MATASRGIRNAVAKVCVASAAFARIAGNSDSDAKASRPPPRSVRPFEEIKLSLHLETDVESLPPPAKGPALVSLAPPYPRREWLPFSPPPTLWRAIKSAGRQRGRRRGVEERDCGERHRKHNRWLLSTHHAEPPSRSLVRGSQRSRGPPPKVQFRYHITHSP